MRFFPIHFAVFLTVYCVDLIFDWYCLFFLMDQFRVCQYLNKRAVTIEDSRESCCFLQKPQMSVQISDVVWSKLIKTNRLPATRAIAITHERTYIR